MHGGVVVVFPATYVLDFCIRSETCLSSNTMSLVRVYCDVTPTHQSWHEDVGRGLLLTSSSSSCGRGPIGGGRSRCLGLSSARNRSFLATLVFTSTQAAFTHLIFVTRSLVCHSIFYSSYFSSSCAPNPSKHRFHKIKPGIPR